MSITVTIDVGETGGPFQSDPVEVAGLVAEILKTDDVKTAMIDGVSELFDKIGNFNEFEPNEIVDTIKEKFEQAKNPLELPFNLLSKKLTGVFSNFKGLGDLMSSGKNSIYSILSTPFKKMSEKLSTTIGKVKNIGDMLLPSNMFSTLGSKIKSFMPWNKGNAAKPNVETKPTGEDTVFDQKIPDEFKIHKESMNYLINGFKETFPKSNYLDNLKQEKGGSLLGSLLGGLLGMGGGFSINKLLMLALPKITGPLAALVTNPITWLIAGIIWSAVEAFRGFKMAKEWGTSGISALLGGLFGGIDSGAKGAVKGMGRWAILGAATGSMIMPGIGTIVGGLIGGILGAILGWIGGEKIAKAFDAVGNWFKDQYNYIVDYWAGIFEGVILWWGDFVKGTKEWFSNVGKWFSTKWETIKTGFGNFITGIANWWNGVVDGVRAGFNNFVTGIANWWNGVIDGAANLLLSIGEWFSNKWNSVVNVATGVKTWIGEKVSVVINAFKQGGEAIGNAFKATGDWFKEKWNSAVEVMSIAKNWIGEKLKLFVDLNKRGMELFGNIFTSIGAWFKEKWDGAVSLFASASDWMGEKVTGVVDTFWAGVENVKEAFGAMGDWFGNMWDKLVNALDNAWNAIKEKGKKLLDWIPGIDFEEESIVPEKTKKTVNPAVQPKTAYEKALEETPAKIWDKDVAMKAYTESLQYNQNSQMVKQMQQLNDTMNKQYGVAVSTKEAMIDGNKESVDTFGRMVKYLPELKPVPVKQMSTGDPILPSTIRDPIYDFRSNLGGR